MVNGPRGARPRQAGAVPDHYRNHDGSIALTYQWFHRRFRDWIAELDLGHCVPHQARHTLATNLLRAGASLTHIRRYLGQVSDRMAEHYVHLSNSDLEDVLQQVWVAGPGTANPGELLTSDTSPMTREQAQALAIDLSRRSTPAEGGFCTFQPVVDGGACPWNLDCHNCDKFVLSGADLLYWRRKREQWRQLAEGAPDDATAEYLHHYFEPTARAIDGLERALAGLGLLDQALAMDLRKPQDYFHRVWSTAFRATDLATTISTAHDEQQRQRRRRTGSLRMSEPARSAPRTAAALAARRRDTQAALGRVHDAIARLRREKTPISVAAVARRAGVSRTFVYTNRTRKPLSLQLSGRPVTNAADCSPRPMIHVKRPGVSGPSTPRTHSRPPTPRSSPNAVASANSSAASATWKPNGHRMPSSGSPPRTPPSNSACVSSTPTTAHSTNDSTQPALTCASKTVASPTLKRGSPNPQNPLRAHSVPRRPAGATYRDSIWRGGFHSVRDGPSGWIVHAWRTVNTVHPNGTR